MKAVLDRRALLAGAAGGAATGLFGAGATAANASDPLVEAERVAILAGMAEADISASAVCLVDQGRPAWVEGFGYASQSSGRGADADTLFSIQSTTKNFTAVAVLLAVQKGVLDLDAPITRYLPDFTVQSRFEASPQDRMTLRLLLANRAGFTHEAPIGNNYEPETPDFEAHVRSISDTWLRFPVGDRYRYSNLGFDLAGYILGQESGLGYAGWLKQELFEPLGMLDSTADPSVYTATDNRSAGAHRGYGQVPLVTPLVASGGVWTNARDMAKWLAFLLSSGRSGDRQILSPDLWAEMHGFGFGGDYGLGVMREDVLYGSTPVRLLTHRGGGFGFGCVFTYCPEAEFGWSAMFNRPALAGYRFGAGLIDRKLAERFGERRPRTPAPDVVRPQTSRVLIGRYVGRNTSAEISEHDSQLRLKQGTAEAQPVLATPSWDIVISGSDGDVVTWRHHPATADLPAHLESFRGELSLDYNDGPEDPEGPDRPEWARHEGRYRVDQWGRSSIEVTVERRRGWLYINDTRLIVEEHPGLFFAADGEAIDFRPETPTWRSLRLHPV